jgi:hypothetical protein
MRDVYAPDRFLVFLESVGSSVGVSLACKTWGLEFESAGGRVLPVLRSNTHSANFMFISSQPCLSALND